MRSVIAKPTGFISRFAITAEGGRRSSVWRVWTGSNKPSDNVYIAPRASAAIKISLHKDGYCQHGPTKELRERLRPADRRALDRWDTAPYLFPGVRIGYSLWFPNSELQLFSQSLAPTVTKVAASPGRHMTFIAVCIVDSPAPLELQLGKLDLVAYLERKSGGAVAVLAGDAELNEEWVEDARAQLVDAGQYWSVPDYTSEENRVAWAFTETEDGSRRVLEIAIREEPVARQRGLAAQFEGSVRDWEELPVPGRTDIDFCAVLQVPHGNSTPQLYVDSRARCDHRHLAEDVEKLLADFHRGDIDSGWDHLPDGSFMTGIITRDTAYSQDITET